MDEAIAQKFLKNFGRKIKWCYNEVCTKFLKGLRMKKTLLAFVVLGVSNVFAASATVQAASQQAMTDCLKTKTQTECNAIQSAAEKTAAKAKSGTTTPAQ